MRAGWWKSLYLQVLVAIVAGIALGILKPDLGAALCGSCFLNCSKE